MAYEEDYSTFWWAVGKMTYVVGVMPYAYPLLTAIGFLAGSDTGEIDRAAIGWHDKTPVGLDSSPFPVSPGGQGQAWHPPMAASSGSQQGAQQSGSSDLSFLRNELQQLTKKIGEKDWKGEAFTSFAQKVKEFDDGLASLELNFKGTGDTLHQTAYIYHEIAKFIKLITNFMVGLATFVLACRALPLTGWSVELNMVMLTVRDVTASVQKVIFSHTKIILKVGVILGIAAVGYNQFSHNLLGLHAVSSGKTPDLIQASAVWDPTTSNITDDPTAGLDTGDLGDTSPLPDIGF